MNKAAFHTLAVVILFCALGSSAGAAPQLLAGTPALNAKAIRLAYSPRPQKLTLGMGLLQIREMQQAGGGGCWNHCFNSFHECMGVSTKDVCVPRVKTCMETCDRLAGMANPMQRPSAPGKASMP